jgi:predicted Zn-dependent protease
MSMAQQTKLMARLVVSRYLQRQFRLSRLYPLPMRAFNHLFARLLAVLALTLLAIQPAAAQSILRDAETEALLLDMAAPLVTAAGLENTGFKVVLINDGSLNAFVAGGQIVYIHSGLIGAASSANEVQGVIAHEIGHITGGHVIRFNEGAKAATGISLLSLLLGVAAAAAGSGDAAMGILMAGQQAALGKFLSFSRAQESSADAAGATFLSKAGITGRGSVEFFKKLQNMEFRYGYTRSARGDDEYYRSHPMTSDRIQTLLDTYEKDPAWNAAPDPALEARFQRVKAKLFGYLSEAPVTFQTFPATMSGTPARYARAYAWHKEALFDKALAEADALLAGAPDDPYFLELKGQILLEAGRPKDSLAPLRRATELSRYSPLIATMFGHALIATEDPANFAEAQTVLKAAVARDRENPFAWRQLGVIYEANGDLARAKLASAEQQIMELQMTQALYSAEAAVAELPQGSADWLRAQDIAMQARTAIEAARERR